MFVWNSLRYVCSHYVLWSLKSVPDFPFSMKSYNSCTKIILNRFGRLLACNSSCCCILVWGCEMCVQWRVLTFNIWVDLKDNQWWPPLFSWCFLDTMLLTPLTPRTLDRPQGAYWKTKWWWWEKYFMIMLCTSRVSRKQGMLRVRCICVSK